MIAIKKLQANETDDFLKLINLFTSESDALKKRALPPKSYLENFLNNPKNHVLAASKNGDIIGGLTAFEMEMYKNAATEMFLFEIEVVKEHRQQGVATSLIEELQNICREKGVRQIFVITDRANYPAIKLYETTRGTPDSNSILYNFYL